jgi:hypothetical protein
LKKMAPEVIKATVINKLISSFLLLDFILILP